MAHDDDLDERAVSLRAGVLADCVEAEDTLDEVIGDALPIRLVKVGELVLAVGVAAVVLEQQMCIRDRGYDSLACVTNAPEDGERYIKITGRYSDFMVTDFHEPSDGAKAFVESQSYDRIMRDDMLGYRRLAADPGWCKILLESNSDGRS